MKKIISILSIILMTNQFYAQNFLKQQKRYKRVRTAISEKNQLITSKLKKNHIELSKLHIILVAYKDESQIEIYAKNKPETTYKKLATYDICASSGQLGPKRAQGDYQVPEGFYHIDRFNPFSNYYLSLGINYPNTSDRIKSKAKNLGGDIFIHGDCVTIGCMPLTDDKIKEVYLYAVYAKNAGQKNIPVYIFPFRMNDQNFRKFTRENAGDNNLIAFWKNLKTGYDKFMKQKKELSFYIDKKGNYIIR